MEYKFKPGDHVIVKENAGFRPSNGDPLRMNYMGKMDEYKGREMIVKALRSDTHFQQYFLKDCEKDSGGYWIWAEEWLDFCDNYTEIEEKEILDLFN